MAGFDVGPFCEALAREQEMYERMLDLSRRQIEAVEQGDATALADVVARKNAVMAGLAPLLGRSEELKKAWQQARDLAPAADRERAESALGRLRDLLEQILAFDDRTRRLMEGIKEEVQRSLRHVHGARHAAQAYKQPGSPPGARFTDTET